MHNNVDGETPDFHYYWQVINAKKKMIGCVVAVVTVVTVVVSLLLPKHYIARAVIMPLGARSGGGLAALAGQLGGMDSLVGLGGVGSQTPAQQFLALLKTRTLAEKIIKSGNLLPRFFPKDSNQNFRVDERSVKFLCSRMQFREDKKGGIIEVSAEFEDPKLAADVANEYVSGLQEFVNENSFTVSKRNRIFIGKQLEENKRGLLEAGKDLSAFYKGDKISSIESHIDIPITKNDTPKSKRLPSENVLNKENNIKEQLQLKLEQLQNKKEEIVSVLHSPQVDGTYFLNPAAGLANNVSSAVDDEKFVKNVPQQVYLQYLTLHRSLLVQINTLLTQQYEMAKINEMKDELAFQVIDPARVPEQRSSPKRALMVMFAFAVSSVLSTFGVVLLENIKRTKQNIK